MMKRNYFLLVLLAVVLFQACVPNRKFEELQAKSNACETNLKSSRDSLRKYTEASAEINRELAELKKTNTVLMRDTALLGSSYRQQKEQYNLINDLNKEIRAQLDLLRKGSEADAQKLNSQLQMTQYELQKKEDELRLLEKDLNAKKADLDAKNADLAAKQKRIDELEALLKKQADAAEALRAKVAEALTSFKDKGLTVVEKNGKVYVSMEAKLLFASGSYAVNTDGKDILIKLAKILETQADLEIMVEGHTDTDKLNSQNTPKDNWELSVLRSTSVVKIMLENSKMDAKKITAAGRSEFIPVDASDKAKNRRIEIILIPNLDALYKLIEGK